MKEEEVLMYRLGRKRNKFGRMEEGILMDIPSSISFPILGVFSPSFSPFHPFSQSNMSGDTVMNKRRDREKRKRNDDVHEEKRKRSIRDEKRRTNWNENLKLE